MRIALLTREWPPDIYGGAGVHVEHLAAELEAVVDLCRGAHVEQGALHAGVFALDVETTDQIGAVFLTRHPACG